MEKFVIYQKSFKKKEGGTFQKWFVNLDDGFTIEATITEKARNHLIKDDLVSPIEIEVEQDGYFFKRKGYKDSTGKSKNKNVFVLLDYVKGVQTQFKQTTTADVISEMKARREEAQATNQETTKNDLPF